MLTLHQAIYRTAKQNTAKHIMFMHRQHQTNNAPNIVIHSILPSACSTSPNTILIPTILYPTYTLSRILTTR